MKKPIISSKIVGLLKFVGEIQQLVWERSQKNNQNVILQYILFPIFHCTSRNSSHSKTIKNAKKLSVFGKNDSRSLYNCLQTYITWNFNHISRTYSQIHYKNIWYAKVIITFVITTQVLFFNVFFRKRPAPSCFWVLFIYMVRLDIQLSKEVCCKLPVERAAIYTGGPHTHRDTDARTMRSPAACVLWI